MKHHLQRFHRKKDDNQKSPLPEVWVQKQSTRSYLDSVFRTRRIVIGSVFSNDMHLKYGVPQGSMLGPRLYCLFSKPIGEIC
jgi:hypothetical protein